MVEKRTIVEITLSILVISTLAFMIVFFSGDLFKTGYFLFLDRQTVPVFSLPSELAVDTNNFFANDTFVNFTLKRVNGGSTILGYNITIVDENGNIILRHIPSSILENELKTISLVFIEPIGDIKEILLEPIYSANVENTPSSSPPISGAVVRSSSSGSGNSGGGGGGSGSTSSSNSGSSTNTNTTNSTGNVTIQTCGNNIREGTEVCDGTALNSQTCVIRGFTGGTLSCNSQCNNFITTQCTSPPVTPSCNLISGSWNVSNVVAGTNVRLNVVANSCSGQQFNYTIVESDDGTSSNIVASFISSSLSPNWTSVYVSDEVGNPEYYFTTRVISNSSESITSSIPLLTVSPIITQTCGNNIREGTEVCDGSQLNGQSCTTRGYVGGTLSCNSQCTAYVTSSCTNQVCGNNIREGTETCDGTALNSQTCTTRGFSGGTLSCNSQCTNFITTQCTSPPAQTCGNNIREGTEICDGSSLAGQSCTTQGFVAGSLSCNNQCSGFVTSSCVNQLCGNNIREGTETCDGSALNGKTCTTQGFTGGTLSCNSQCTNFVTTQCTSPPAQTCGNNIREGTEVCDGSQLNGQSCTTRGYVGGTLSCNSQCTAYVTSSCTNQVCGNNIREGTETCDGTALNSQTCTTRGFSGGTLSCNSQCTNFVTTQCTSTNPQPDSNWWGNIVRTDVSSPAINVTSGQSIQSAINSASTGQLILVRAGTYTGPVNVNKAVRLVAEPGVNVTINCNTNVDCIEINSNNVLVEGFRIIRGATGISGYGRNNIVIRSNYMERVNYGIWADGTNWLIEGNEINRIIRYNSGGDADYTRMFGNNLTFRYNYLHGTQIPGDLGPGPDYAHTDASQFYNQNGEIYKNIVIEGNYFTDMVQGLFLADEVGSATSANNMVNITIKNNVFWGTNLQATGNILGNPSHCIYLGKYRAWGGNIVIQNNFLTNCANVFTLVNQGPIALNRNIVYDAGTVYSLEGNTNPSSILVGNALWGNNWGGLITSNLDLTNTNPQLANANNPLGNDGRPFTNDDGWRPTNSAFDNYGPEL